MEIDYKSKLPLSKKYLNPSLLTNMSEEKNTAPKRKIGGIIMQEDIPEEFKAEIIKRSMKPQNPVINPAPGPVFKFQSPVIKPGKQEVGLKTSSSSSRSSSSSLPKVKKQKGGLTVPTAPKSEFKTPNAMPKKPPKTKYPVRRPPTKKQVIFPSNALYKFGEDVELQPNDNRDKSLTFRVLNRLGKGSYGEVFQVYPITQPLPDYFPKLDNGNISYAMKVMINPEGMTSFEYEHEIMDLIASNFANQSGRCPSNVLCYFDISKDKNGRYYMLSEKMYGSIGDYAEKMKATSSKIGLALKVFEQTMNGLEELSKIGLLHRDLKEENLLYTIPMVNGRPKPSDIKIKIGDFGLSCVVESMDLECGQDVVGSPIYIDPYILLSNLHLDKLNQDEEMWSEENDMYSLAVILYQLIFGRYLQAADWYSMRPGGKTNSKLLKEGYQKVYNRNIVNVKNLLKDYENSTNKKSKKIENMLHFIIRNLNPFDMRQRTNIEKTMKSYL
jgi:serine/threonine protein kinase